MNSDPPRSLNCNGYPGLNEYGGNSINTTANNQTVTNTSSSQATQMQPPSTQSSNRQQSSRPSPSNHNYLQQSPNQYTSSIHVSTLSPSKRDHQVGGSTTAANGPQQFQHNDMLSTTSHHQGEVQNEWNQNTWNENQNDIFNQSDRIHLNNRLKTMILNKNEKDQQQPTTGHFLSFSHQHLTQHQLLNSLNNIDESRNNKTTKSETKLLVAGDDGGFKISDSWKTSVLKQESVSGKNKDHSEPKNELNECGSQDQISEIKDNKVHEQSIEDSQIPSNLQSSTSDTGSDQQHATFRNNLPKQEKMGETDKEKQSYSYHSAHEYEQHQNMVNHIKKEPGDDSSVGNMKYEGYEKNYQNFIRYADFCDAQQPQFENPQRQQAQYQQDYMQSPGYYNNYAYQNYSHQQSQNYNPQHSQNYQQFMSQQAAYQHGHHHPSSLTNFEQQIPLHAYPIPKHTTSKIGEPNLNLSEIKSEPISTTLHPYPFLSENIAPLEKDLTENCQLSHNESSHEIPSEAVLSKREVNY